MTSTPTPTKKTPHEQAAWLRRALSVTPGGSQTKSKAPGKVGPRDRRAGFPLFADSGLGAYLHADGKQYLDFAGANAAVPLGYSHPAVVEAVRTALESGPLLSMPSTLEVEASEALCHAVKAERVRWVKTGSEATTAAVKIARAVTRASAVVVSGQSYHGWHDWTLARFHDGAPPDKGSLPNGVPSVLGCTVFTYDYERDEDPMVCVNHAQMAGYKVAAVVIEPHRFIARQRDRLLAARAAADTAHALLIFDEMVYGFRWAKGGGGEYFGVQPDLSCYGKALGNGVPVACVAGAAPLMDYAAELISSTFGSDRLGLAAALAVLRTHERDNVIRRLWENGDQFWAHFEHTYGAAGRGSGRLEGFPVHFRIRWRTADEADDVLTRCAARGVLFHRDACNASAAMRFEECRFGARVLAEELRAAEGRQKQA